MRVCWLLGGLLATVGTALAGPASVRPCAVGWVIANDHYRLVLDTRAGLRLASLENLALPAPSREMLGGAGRRDLFEVRVPGAAGPVALPSTALRVTGASVSRSPAGTKLRLALRPLIPTDLHRAELTIHADATPETVWSLSVTPVRSGSVAVALPILDGLRLGDPATTQYVWPHWAGVLDNVPFAGRTYYGQYARMQVMAASGLVAGREAGVSVVARDTSLLRKSFELDKRVPGLQPRVVRHEYGLPYWDGCRGTAGVGLAVFYPGTEARAGQTVTFPPAAIGVFSGTWREGLANYRRWRDTWYRPRQREQVRRIFNYGFVDLFAKQSLAEALAEVPALQRFDCVQFMVQKQHVNGVYDYREDFGLEGLRQYVAALHQAGLPACHYVEGYIVNTKSPIYEQHGPEWQQMAGKDKVMAFANEAMCLSWPPWHRFVADTASRLVRDLGFDIIYLDEVGFGTLDKNRCDNPAHGHGDRSIGLPGAVQLARTVRSAVDAVSPRVGLSTEGPAVDVLMGEMDSVEDYGCRQTLGVPVHLLRFVFPDFKFIDLPLGTPEEQLRQLRHVFFNGNAAANYLEATPVARDAQRLFSTLQRSRDAFMSLHPEPLVPTAHTGVYANRFPGEATTVTTVYNTNPYRVAGAVLPVAAAPDTHHFDLLHQRELALAASSGRPSVVLDLAPGAVTAVGALPRAIVLEQYGLAATVRAPGAPRGAWLELARLDGDDFEVGVEALSGDAPRVDLAAATGDAYRAVVRLMADGVLLDARNLPRPDDVDIARWAVATVAAPLAGEKPPDPAVVNDADHGSVWAHPWNAEWPAWLRLDWNEPQPCNSLLLRAADAVYMPLIYEVQTSSDGQSWTTVARVEHAPGQAQLVQETRFPLQRTRHLRILFTKGSWWAGRADIATCEVRCLPEP